MKGKCAYQSCIFGTEDEVNAEPCAICAKLVHHICSNLVHEGELSERFCSIACYSKKRSTREKARFNSKKDKIDKKRFHFSEEDDLNLFKEVINVEPYAAKHGEKEKKWDFVACNLCYAYGRELSFKTVRDRFNEKMKEFQKKTKESKRASGVEENYTEYEHLLKDIHDREEAFKNMKEEKKYEKIEKKRN